MLSLCVQCMIVVASGIMNSVLLVQVLLWLSVSGSFAAFLVSPSSFNASEGSNVTFYCHINESGNLLFWLVNDEFSNSIANQNRSIQLLKYSNIRSILTIPAHTWNDNVDVQCVYRSFQSTSLNCSDPTITCSEKARLRIQGLLSPPFPFNGKSLATKFAIDLMWEAPPSLDLTDIDPDIIHYEISVVHNKTGQTENFVMNGTNFTYYAHSAHGSDLCQQLEFSVLAVNVVGRGSKNTINVSPQEAPSIKLQQGIESTIQENAKIECTTTCSNIITWRVHKQLDDRNGQRWYEVIASNQSGDVCTEIIALTPVWATQSIKAVSVQCVAVSVCPNGSQTTCLQGVCLSDIQEVVNADVFYQRVTNDNTVDDKKGTFHQQYSYQWPIACDDLIVHSPTTVPAMNKTEIGLICGSTVLVTTLGLLVVVLVILTARARISRSDENSCRENSRNKEERIYASPIHFTVNEVGCSHTNLEMFNKDPGSLYSLPLPTDPCPAYDTFTKK